MDADFSVELGPPDEEATLELPWRSDHANGPRYLDLKRHPEMLALVPEASQYPELGAFLQALNSPASIFETAKCDAWLTDELTEAEQVYGAACQQGAYVDLVFAAEQAEARLSFFRHEEWARALVALLKNAPDIPAAFEIIVRRCYYHQPATPSPPDPLGPGTLDKDDTEVRVGFYLTLYLFGYGDDEREARQRWGETLRFVADAVLQLSAVEQRRAQ